MAADLEGFTVAPERAGSQERISGVVGKVRLLLQSGRPSVQTAGCNEVVFFSFFFFLIFFFNVYLFWGQRETEHEWGRGREREGDTESETGSRL